MLEHHGWGDLQGELNQLARAGRWDEITTLVDDEVLSQFVVIAEPGQVFERVKERFEGLVDRAIIRYSAEGLPGAPRAQAVTRSKS